MPTYRHFPSKHKLPYFSEAKPQLKDVLEEEEEVSREEVSGELSWKEVNWEEVSGESSSYCRVNQWGGSVRWISGG